MNKLVTVMVLFLAACSDDFDPGSLVNKTRVLAVQADTPFAMPGQAVQLHALAYDPLARSLSWGWGECEDATSASAVDCLRQTNFDSLQIGADVTTHSFTVPNTSSVYAGVVVIACPGTIERGETQTIPIVCRDANGTALSLDEFEIGMKRIYLRPSELNKNPQIDGLSYEGASWTAELTPTTRCKKSDCSEYVDEKIVVTADGASEQSIDALGLPITEQSVIQYYATGGEFDDELKLASAGENKWHARKEDAGKLIRFWFVVRDDRGGVSWIERSLQVP